MNRKEFIKYGAVITAGAFMANATGLQAFSGDSRAHLNTLMDPSSKRPDPNQFQEPILKAIALGIHAPSPHNIQSWKFKVLNDLEMELYVDENKLLPATDPPARQVHIGAGCFMEAMVQGASRYGYTAQATYFPDGYQSEKDFGKKPVARITLDNTRIPKDPLAEYIEKRQTSRIPYKGSIITTSQFEKIKSDTGDGHATISFINESMEPYLDIFYRAMEVESKTYATNEETRTLFRFTEEQRKSTGDGISIPQMGYKGVMQRIAENSLKNGDPSTWHSEKNLKATMKGFKKGIYSTKGIVIWHTQTNEFIDWVLLGRDYVRFSHALTKHEMYCHPYNQAIQEYQEMEEISRELNDLYGIKAPQKIQMIVRIGKSPVPYYSYRRPLKRYLMG